ncbi:putative high-molecular-weight surface-exposed protein [Campylobacter hyointestinalis subsp. hyointestinalis]|uniref:High-molecular-weight surface-exposed protein n=1 Tax=Campylobacter hyointestinalis subsp. hyointestinalis TaxID=91352 RepID=A0A9W5EWN3_CAMHY|nr:hypothetical protein [Campylobacter hyointestinalis]CUU89019.1 putative high-molecular-weight surface-exposed protein [Campylobacter hyointestinalis subsp. hyointestinalis]CUU91250.1 putative high-molecular-weight surface-exposed protein [Campylobacter hyointestinalis subsp. hyointestinalis]CUU91619.1 putative high-molecular-weight surface-exposed protein [Campylobacter hyointestinalis subsp. hyointestinalis]
MVGWVDHSNSLVHSSTSISNNNVTLRDNGSTTIDDVFGGYSETTTVENNTINISGNPTFGVTTVLYGGDELNGRGDNFTSNTLNIHAKDIKVKNIVNFDFINFYLPNNIKSNDTLLNLSNADNTQTYQIQK